MTWPRPRPRPRRAEIHIQIGGRVPISGAGAGRLVSYLEVRENCWEVSRGPGGFTSTRMQKGLRWWGHPTISPPNALAGQL